MGEPFVSNIISHKYDTALDFHITMYDNLPYQRDSDYCNAEKLGLISGQVIKFYLYIRQPENFLTTGTTGSKRSFRKRRKQSRITAWNTAPPLPSFRSPTISPQSRSRLC